MRNRVWCILIWWNGVEPQPWGRISAAFPLSLCCIIIAWCSPWCFRFRRKKMDDILTARVFIGSDGLGWTWKIEDDQFCFVRFGDDDLVQFHGGMHSANVGRFPTWHKLTSSLRWTSQFSHFYYYSAPAHFIFCPNKKVLNFHFQVFVYILQPISTTVEPWFSGALKNYTKSR